MLPQPFVRHFKPSIHSNWSYHGETPNSGQNRQFFVQCDLEIWWMTYKNNRGIGLIKIIWHWLCTQENGIRWVRIFIHEWCNIDGNHFVNIGIIDIFNLLTKSVDEENNTVSSNNQQIKDWENTAVLHASVDSALLSQNDIISWSGIFLFLGNMSSLQVPCMRRFQLLPIVYCNLDHLIWIYIHVTNVTNMFHVLRLKPPMHVHGIHPITFSRLCRRNNIILSFWLFQRQITPYVFFFIDAILSSVRWTHGSPR